LQLFSFLVVGFITYFALDKYAGAALGPVTALGVHHVGTLDSLRSGISASPSAKVSLAFSAGSAESVRKLHVEETRARNYSELIDKICSVHSCILCEKSNSATTIGLKDGQCIREIRQDEGVPVYGCASNC
jgi:hypothetical protein